MMTSEPLCGALTASGRPCRRRVPDGGPCAQHRPGEVAGLAGGQFRSAVLDAYELTDAEARMLDQASRVLDVIDQLDAVVAADGPTSTGSAGQVVTHPAVAEARMQRLAFGRLVAQLDLPDPDDAHGDPTVWTPQATAARRAAQARWRRRRGAG